MKDELIKEVLSKDLKNFSTENINEKIINQLNITDKKEKKNLFKESEVIKVFVFVFLFVFVANLGVFPKLNQTVILIGSIICVTPIFLIAYDKIYKSTR